MTFEDLTGSYVRVADPFPEAVLTPLLSSVGKQYPALTASGRDLYVRVPTGAGMALEPGAVRLTAP